ncbi:M4 family metallopeptidase [Streptomyces sp. VRA16 Mangrove soil]|uniref:M4 family metallopeptidase n=1 Tax=Streptomyces sp. VRA16 Mangrove soil TaxID=2817434 RepID=UPI001A9D1BD3|nr:M4 family metallopeptidase [Streptomyces sp. VRA16 Mangrove soil]MBO1329787.1 M4 family metallopeptidase [Streptomyces sp. VRA16 Mangrove soil]
MLHSPARGRLPRRRPRSQTASRRRSTTLVTLVAALMVTAVPVGAAAEPADAGPGPHKPAPRLIDARPRPGAQPVRLTAAQRRHLVDQATDDRAETARKLGLGTREKLVVKDVVQDTDGTRHIRYERTYSGLPVIGGDLVVHDDAGRLTATTSSQAELSVPTTKAAVSEGAARQKALTAAKKEQKRQRAARAGESAVTSRRVIWTVGAVPQLAWENVVSGERADGTPSRLHVVTDATSGRLLSSYDDIQAGEGHSQYSGTVSVASRLNGTVYELADQQRGNHRTYDVHAGPATLLTDTDDVWGDGTSADPQTAAVDAAYGAQRTWDFYHDRFGRNGIADDGVGATSRVHYGTGYANAFWDDLCFCMTYGDGLDGNRPLTELDIAAHEMTHGVTSATAGLIYTGESGGLNEATSDIMGTAVEFFADNAKDTPDYLIGELANVRGTGKPLRYMDQPSKDASAKGTSQDSWTPDTKKLDPHFSSGVANHFFYLLAEGSGSKTLRGVSYDSPTADGLPVAGLGLHNATNVWYRALTHYMTSTTDYAGARTATLQAAADLFGTTSDAYEAVGNAWAAVNVGPRYVHHIAADAPSGRDAATGQPVNRQITATSTRPGALSYAATGLPDGLAIAPETGRITGTPTRAGEFDVTVRIKNSAAETLDLPFTWTVLASGGDHFVNPDRFDIPNWHTIESPLTVTGHPGQGPAELKVSVDLVHDFIGGQVINLVSEDGTVLPVKNFVWDTGTELHETFTVDASAVPANGTWKLQVIDNTPGIFLVDPGYLDRWSMTF